MGRNDEEGDCKVVLFLWSWDVTFLLWFPSAGLTVGKAFCALSFGLSSPGPSLVWAFALFKEFSRRWFRMELLAMVVLALGMLCCGPCVWLLWSHAELPGFPWSGYPSLTWSRGLLTVSCLYLRVGLAQGWGCGKGLAELQKEQPYQPMPTSLFGSSPCSWLLFLMSV